MVLEISLTGSHFNHCNSVRPLSEYTLRASIRDQRATRETALINSSFKSCPSLRTSTTTKISQQQPCATSSLGSIVSAPTKTQMPVPAFHARKHSEQATNVWRATNPISASHYLEDVWNVNTNIIRTE